MQETLQSKMLERDGSEIFWDNSNSTSKHLLSAEAGFGERLSSLHGLIYVIL